MRFIRCSKCYLMYELEDGKMPDHCIRCNNDFRPRLDEASMIGVIHNILFGKTDRGYMECDNHGFVKGKQLIFPDERTENIV